jgi:hypothetical protein
MVIFLSVLMTSTEVGKLYGQLRENPSFLCNHALAIYGGMLSYHRMPTWCI